MEYANLQYLFVVCKGLAASLQQRVLAQMKIKEERDERQKRAEISPIHNGSVTITPTAHIKTEGQLDLIMLQKNLFRFLYILQIELNANNSASIRSSK